MKLIVTADKLNVRRIIPSALPDRQNISGMVKKGFSFDGEEVISVPNPALGKWYRDNQNNFYWGGGLAIEEEPADEQAEENSKPDNTLLEEKIPITPVIKKKIEKVINAFETGSAEGNYAALVKFKDYLDPETGAKIVQVTFGRSQTTEFGNLKALVRDYIESNGTDAAALRPFLERIGKKPSLATDDVFCNTLIRAGKSDAVMHACQDRLFDSKYYQPAFTWFTVNGFALPLSLLVIYDSMIHSGRILPFLRKKFTTAVPASGGDEHEWIANYVNARHNWLANHSDALLRNTVYRTSCFKEQIRNDNWNLSQTVRANGVDIT